MNTKLAVAFMAYLLVVTPVVAEPFWYQVTLVDGRSAQVLVMSYDASGIVYQAGEDARVIPVSALSYETKLAFHYVAAPSAQEVKAARDAATMARRAAREEEAARQEEARRRQTQVVRERAAVQALQDLASEVARLNAAK